MWDFTYVTLLTIIQIFFLFSEKSRWSYQHSPTCFKTSSSISKRIRPMCNCKWCCIASFFWQCECSSRTDWLWWSWCFRRWRRWNQWWLPASFNFCEWMAYNNFRCCYWAVPFPNSRNNIDLKAWENPTYGGYWLSEVGSCCIFQFLLSSIDNVN